jgi:hypothetical protein
MESLSVGEAASFESQIYYCAGLYTFENETGYVYWRLLPIGICIIYLGDHTLVAISPDSPIRVVDEFVTRMNGSWNYPTETIHYNGKIDKFSLPFLSETA